ncbi:MAG: hypothetical protein S4CHLAM2_14800 [Chlamydiales bacterium]|nr:hypothetical protein [Chlamydiales bacterium]
MIYNLYANAYYALAGPSNTEASPRNLHKLIREQKEYILYYTFDGLHPLAYAVKIGDLTATTDLLRYQALEDYNKTHQETIIHIFIRSLCETEAPNIPLLKLLLDRMPRQYDQSSLMPCLLDHVEAFETIPWNVIQELLRRGIGKTTAPPKKFSATNRTIYLCLQNNPPGREQIERILKDQIAQLKIDCETWERMNSLTHSQTRAYSSLLNEQIQKTKAVLMLTTPQLAVAITSLTDGYGSALIAHELLQPIANLSDECRQLVRSLASETSQGSSSSGNKSP